MVVVVSHIQRAGDDRDRDRLWITFLNRLHFEMGKWSERIPSTRSVMRAMEEIGIDISDFIEPTKAV